MTRIVIVGAGGHVFPLRLINDFLSFPALADAEYVLMDVDRAAVERTAKLARGLAEAHALSAHIRTSTELNQALRGADFVVTCFQVGGLAAYAHDVEIPRRYGIDQTVGDTLGPGGVFRGLRSMKALDEITRVMGELCPSALLLNYANPMSINCAFASSQGIRTVGLCHSVQHTADELAAILGFTDDDWSFRAAGINHQAWMLDFRRHGRDILPELRAAVDEYHAGGRNPAVEIDEWYAGGREGVRTVIMDLVGYFQTESSHHASEYYPYFRRTPADVAKVIPERWDYYEISVANTDEVQAKQAAEYATGPLKPSEEYAARIIDSIVSNTPRAVYGNVPNSGLITNLPEGICVEVPVLVDGSGTQPTYIGDLPVACAATNLASIGLQLCAVEAYRTESRALVYNAIALDRMTSSIIGLDEIRKMTDELFEAEKQWLPTFR